MIKRREFLKKIALLAGVMGGGALLPAGGKAADQEIGIAVVEGENPKAQVQEAIRLLGGIQRFVRRGDRVVILPNPQGIGRGVTTNPDIVAETTRLCLAAGASSVNVSSCHGQERWLGTGIIEKVEASGGRMKYPDSDRDWATIAIPNARVRKEVTVIREAKEMNKKGRIGVDPASDLIGRALIYFSFPFLMMTTSSPVISVPSSSCPRN
jgi:hypothetical protein